MTATPNQLVHWTLDVSLSEFGSPFSEATSSDSISSTSSVQYINSQLIAHGYTENPGLSLEGLGKDDANKVVKCLLGMLSQRVNDMSRTEDLTTKIRTMSYDNERLMSMYQAATERAAHAEREMNLHKSRLAAATRNLQSTEVAHKHTTAELQRTRTSLQAIRTAHQTEIKKLDKEKERMVERWSKISDSQLKAATSNGGIRSANFDVVEASDVPLRGKGQGLLETALEEAQQARKELFDQNRKLRRVILSTANEIQSIQHAARNCVSSEGEDEPLPLTLTTLFPISPTEAAGDKLGLLLTSLRESITRLSKPSSTSTPSSTPINEAKPNDSAETERFQAVIDTLHAELEQAQKQSSAYASEIQTLFDHFTQDKRINQEDIGEISVDLMTAPARDEERQRLELRFKVLDEERKKFTEAAVRLGKEKAALEAERIKFLEEKRSWQVDMMLAELPPTPGPSSEPAVAAPPSVQTAAPRSPRRSPRKSLHKPKGALAVGKPGSGKKIRVSRQSSGFGVGLGRVSPKKVSPPFETEVIPSSPKQLPNFKTSIALAHPQAPLHAPAFVLPPPSPEAALPQANKLPSSLDIPQNQSALATPASPSDENLDEKAQQISSATSPVPVSPTAIPSTPILRRPFPMAKPLVPHMVHAYSPVKPSPLSRILLLANSPDSPETDVPRLGSLAEEEDDDLEVSPTPAAITPVTVALPPAMSLAAELGIADDDDDESPLREKRAERNAAEPKSVHAAVRQAVAKGKGKARTEVSAASRGTVIPGEKENVKRAKSSTSGTTVKATPLVRDEKKTARPPPKPSVVSARTRFTINKLPQGKGGARRVPIDSAEAAPVGPGWKG
ncbi:Afadin and alpha-actinin-binding-domain-containing protein [Sparassis latifolia]